MESNDWTRINGKFVPATPLDFMCEVDGCNETKHVKEYVRKPEECTAGWDDEPICLCKKHSIKHKSYCPND